MNILEILAIAHVSKNMTAASHDHDVIFVIVRDAQLVNNFGSVRTNSDPIRNLPVRPITNPI